jgi:hypothetical protein
MASFSDQLLEIANLANFTDAQKAILVTDFLATQGLSAPATPSATAAATTAAPSAPASTASRDLAGLVSQYAVLDGPVYAGKLDSGVPATHPDGSPWGLPSFNVYEPAAVFAAAGPEAIWSIFTGPGLLRAAFEAAQRIQQHGPGPVRGDPAVTPAVVAAVRAYIAANPSLVPTGSNDPGLEIAGTVAPIYPTLNVTQAQLDAAAAFDAKIAAEDHGAGTNALTSLTADDLHYIANVAGPAAFPQGMYGFLQTYTNATQQQINDAVNATDTAQPNNAPSNPDAKVKAAVDAYAAAWEAAKAKRKAAR